ncbi:hypothetical protein C4552_02275 [Candidatus Parcubacteria bacterium]|nr:MAG: hypothetical protein C4552_02275 [Candidatus Parcubacteria bacterium]
MLSKFGEASQKVFRFLKIFFRHFWPIFGVLLVALLLEVGYFFISPSVKGISFSFNESSYGFEASIAREGNEILYPADDQIAQAVREAVEQKEINEFIGWLRSSPRIEYNIEIENHLALDQFSGTQDEPIFATSTAFTLKCTPPGNGEPVEIDPGQRRQVLSSIRITEVSQRWQEIFCAISNVGQVIDSPEIAAVRLGGSLVVIPKYTDKSWWLFYFLSYIVFAVPGAILLIKFGNDSLSGLPNLQKTFSKFLKDLRTRK